MKSAVITLFLALGLGGCVNAAPEFTWYHPMSGEHLFAFDADECTDRSVAQGLAMTADVKSPFFSCMRQRGYSLVDAQGNQFEPTVAAVSP